MQDLRYTLRSLSKNRGFAAAAIATLPLGIGGSLRERAGFRGLAGAAGFLPCRLRIGGLFELAQELLFLRGQAVAFAPAGRR